MLIYLIFSKQNRSSGYDRERGSSDIKKRLSDFSSKRDDSYSSKRDHYKSSRADDFRRDIDVPVRHSSNSFGASSARVESASSISKDRYPERSSSDYRGGSSRATDERDSRNGASKPRFLEPPVENRFGERANAPSSTAWNSTAAHATFGINTPGIWAEKQTADPSAWRGLDDNRYDRFTSNDRKPVTGQFIVPTVQRNQNIGETVIYPRIVNNRYDNGRF